MSFYRLSVLVSDESDSVWVTVDSDSGIRNDLGKVPSLKSCHQFKKKQRARILRSEASLLLLCKARHYSDNMRVTIIPLLEIILCILTNVPLASIPCSVNKISARLLDWLWGISQSSWPTSAKRFMTSQLNFPNL